MWENMLCQIAILNMKEAYLCVRPLKFPENCKLRTYEFWCWLWYCIPLACVECDYSLLFLVASFIPPCYVLFLSLFSANYFSILLHFILPSISWPTAWFCWFQIHIQYSLGTLFSSTLFTCPNQRYFLGLTLSLSLSLSPLWCGF
jgi:hypothetical protein